MTELQLGLLVFGAVVVAGVFAYNRLQERSARRAAERVFRSAAGDALLGEPPAARREPGAPETRPPPERSATLPAVALPDARIDYVVELAFEPPAPAGQLLELWKVHEHRYARRALLACSADGVHWSRLPSAEGNAQVLQAGLQLVSRDGPVDEAELIEFRAALDSLAAASGAGIAAPEMRQAVEQARALDAFCADADIQVVFHVMPMPGTGFDELAVGGAAEQAGLTLEADERYTLRDDDEREMFSLAWRDGAGGAGGLSITLDVPRAPGGRGSFHAMARCARQLAATLGGALVDDNGQVLDERALAAIAAQLDAVHAAFAARGIDPGSAVALRLFS